MPASRLAEAVHMRQRVESDGARKSNVEVILNECNELDLSSSFSCESHSSHALAPPKPAFGG